MNRDKAFDILVDLFMEGREYLRIDVAKILDGHNVDELLLLIAREKYNAAREWLRSHVERFMLTDLGEEIIDAFIREDEQMRRDADIDARIDEKLLAL